MNEETMLGARTLLRTLPSCRRLPRMVCLPQSVVTWTQRRAWTSVPLPIEPEGGHAVASLDVSCHAALLKCIDKEIDDEKLRIDKEPPKLPSGWDIQHTPGTSYFTMERSWNNDAEKHYIKVNLTQRDTSLDPECDIRGEHFPFQVLIERNGKVMDFNMDVIEGEIVINNIQLHDFPLMAYDRKSMSTAFDRAMLFGGPNLDEVEDEVLDGMHAFLVERQLDDQFAEFVAHYSAWIEQEEYEAWLQHFRNFLTA